jgi:hypothetical protein
MDKRAGASFGAQPVVRRLLCVVEIPYCVAARYDDASLRRYCGIIFAAGPSCFVAGHEISSRAPAEARLTADIGERAIGA